MARYHFNIRNGHGFTADEEGADLPSDADARDRAIEGARSLMSAQVLEGVLDLDGRIEVTEEGRGAVMSVHYREAVEVRSEEPVGGTGR